MSRERGLNFHFYNRERIHQALGYKTPYGVYFEEAFNLKIMQSCQTVHLKQAHYCLDNGEYLRYILIY
jgi:hypothetical protein